MGVLEKKHLACFVSPHGFGHASRTAAVLEHLLELDASLFFHLFTTVPRWFFEVPLAGNFSHHLTDVDVGFVQRTPFLEDLEKTADALDAFLPLSPAWVETLAETVSRLNCRAVLCDISPLGISVAKQAGIPSILVENFTWDFLYAGYPGFSEQVKHHIDHLSFLFDSADHRIQTEPVCRRKNARLTLPPISRKPRSDARAMRERLGIENGQDLVLITSGGIPGQLPFLSRLKDAPHFHFLVPGGSEATTVNGNVCLLPHFSPFYHPDLVHASDFVIGKAGYSTVAEVYCAGAPFGFVPRPGFPESSFLSDFIERRMDGHRISVEAFYQGDWIFQIKDWMSPPEKREKRSNGAGEAARFILDLLNP